MSTSAYSSRWHVGVVFELRTWWAPNVGINSFGCLQTPPNMRTRVGVRRYESDRDQQTTITSPQVSHQGCNLFFYCFTPTLSGKSVCGQLLIRSILVLLFSFEVPLKKNYKKRGCSKKKNRKRNEKKQQQRRGFVCVFFSFVRWCFVITFVSRLVSLAQSSLGPAYYHR
jgi:hypothetical protein